MTYIYAMPLYIPGDSRICHVSDSVRKLADMGVKIDYMTFKFTEYGLYFMAYYTTEDKIDRKRAKDIQRMVEAIPMINLDWQTLNQEEEEE